MSSLTNEGILRLVKQMKNLQPRQILSEEFIFQIVDNYYPSKEFPGWLGFRISDGFTKIKCFMSQKNEFISSLQRNREDQLQKYPVIKTKELIDITSSQKGDLEPFVMVKSYEVVYEDIDQIIGCPLPYKIYEERGFRNPQGKSEIPLDDHFDFDELEKNLKSFDEPVKENLDIQSKQNIIPQKRQEQPIVAVKPPVFQVKLEQISNQQLINSKSNNQKQSNIQSQQTNNNHVNYQQPQQPIRNQQYYQEKQQESQAQSHQTTLQTNLTGNQTQFKTNNYPNQKQNVPVQQTVLRNQDTNNQQQRPNPQQFQATHQKQLAQKVQNQQPQQECYPISMLNNMTQHPFKGRVVKLDDVRAFGGKNGKKEGKLFGVQIMDENDLISGTFFDGAVDKWYNKLTLGRVYIFSGAQIKLSRNPDINKQMGAINFDAMFDVNAKIEETDDDPDIPSNKFNFTSLGLIPKKNREDIVDTIGIIKYAGSIQEFIPKFKTEPQFRRTLIIYDQSLSEIEISLFGNYSSKYDFAINEIYQFKYFKVSEYNCKRGLQSCFNSSIHDDLQIKEAKVLAEWRLNAGDEIQLQKIADVDTVKGLKTIEQLLHDTKACETDKQQKVFISSLNINQFYSNIRAHLMFVKGSGTIYYQSCTQCLKKAVQDHSGGYSCKSCSIQMDEPKYRYILTLKLVDSTGNLWVTAGDQVAAQLISTTADIIKQYNDQGKEKEKNDALNENVYREYKFKISSKLEEYNDQQRVKHQIVSASQESLIDDTNQYLKLIQFYVDNV